MAIGPVQLLVLGFEHPDFHGEMIAELERLKNADTVRVIDSLAVCKDADGEIEVMHLSNLTKDEAIELGSKVGALIGLGIDGEEGAEVGAEAGAEAAAEDGINVFNDAGLGRARRHPKRLRRGLDPAGAPLGCGAPRRDCPRGWIPHLRRVHQPARPGRDRTGDCGGGRAAPCPRAGHGVRVNDRRIEMMGSRRVARRTSRRVARRR